MNQLGLDDSGFMKHPKTTRKAQFLATMNQVVPWSRLVGEDEPYYPKPGKGHRPIPLETNLRTHFMQQWFAHSDPTMEEALHDIPLLRRFAGLDTAVEGMPYETAILKFRHLLERHGFATAMHEEINALPGERALILRKGKHDPEMRSTKKGNQWYSGMKARIAADTTNGLMGTVSKVPDVTVTDELLHGEEHMVHGDDGYRTNERNPPRKRSGP